MLSFLLELCHLTTLQNIPSPQLDVCRKLVIPQEPKIHLGTAEKNSRTVFFKFNYFIKNRAEYHILSSHKKIVIQKY